MHYTVAVITNDGDEGTIEDLLAPYDEGIEVAPYIDQTKQEIIDNKRKQIESLKRDMESYANGTYDTENYCTYWLGDDGNFVPYWKEILELDGKPDEELYKHCRYEGDEDNYDENGNELSTYNPKSKWDWYTIGGRWDGYFNLKETNDNSNSAKISDIVWEGTAEQKAEAKEFWEQYIEGKLPANGKEPMRFWYKKEYYTERYNGKEDYIERSTFTCPYAVVTPDGVWHAPGEMHWFSSSEDGNDQIEYENWFRNYIKENQDKYITLVDCHI